MKMATELTPLNEETHAYYYSSPYFKQHRGKRCGYIKFAWSQISIYFWRCAILIFGLLVVNTILKSIFFKQTSLMFTSSTNDDLSNLSAMNVIDEIKPNIIWIVTSKRVKLNKHSHYLNKLAANGVLLQEYYTSTNRISSLLSKYDYKLTEDDMDKIHCFDSFLAQKYQIKKLYDDTVEYIEDAHSRSDHDTFPFLMYVQLDDETENNEDSIDDKVKEIVSFYKAKRNVNIWQNSILIVSSDYSPNENEKSFAMLAGPRVPSKKRGTKYLSTFYSVDWVPTLLRIDDDDFDGYDLWNSIIYNKSSPRTNDASNRYEEKHKIGITQNIKI